VAEGFLVAAGSRQIGERFIRGLFVLEDVLEDGGRIGVSEQLGRSRPHGTRVHIVPWYARCKGSSKRRRSCRRNKGRTPMNRDQIGGQSERLLGVLQEKYGYARDRAEKELKRLTSDEKVRA
jgi:hypothetical protein